METPLKQTRLKANSTQAKIAQVTLIDRGQYSRYESGKERPTPEKAARIASYFREVHGLTITETEILYPERCTQPTEPTDDPCTSTASQ